MNIINLTPHTVNIFDENHNQLLEIAPSGTIARCDVTRTKASTIDNIPFFTTVIGEVTDLPEPKENTIFVVSAIVLNKSNRKDLFAPGELLRNDSGQPIGCIGLSR